MLPLNYAGCAFKCCETCTAFNGTRRRNKAERKGWRYEKGDEFSRRKFCTWNITLLSPFSTFNQPFRKTFLFYLLYLFCIFRSSWLSPLSFPPPRPNNSSWLFDPFFLLHDIYSIFPSLITYHRSIVVTALNSCLSSSAILTVISANHRHCLGFTTYFISHIPFLWIRSNKIYIRWTVKYFLFQYEMCVIWY